MGLPPNHGGRMKILTTLLLLTVIIVIGVAARIDVLPVCLGPPDLAINCLGAAKESAYEISIIATDDLIGSGACQATFAIYYNIIDDMANYPGAPEITDNTVDNNIIAAMTIGRTADLPIWHPLKVSLNAERQNYLVII